MYLLYAEDMQFFAIRKLHKRKKAIYGKPQKPSEKSGDF